MNPLLLGEMAGLVPPSPHKLRLALLLGWLGDVRVEVDCIYLGKDAEVRLGLEGEKIVQVDYVNGPGARWLKAKIKCYNDNTIFVELQTSFQGSWYRRVMDLRLRGKARPDGVRVTMEAFREVINKDPCLLNQEKQCFLDFLEPVLKAHLK